MVTHSLTMLEKNLVYSGDSSPRNFTTKRVKRRSIKSEDPMSHRIIEKRRRDRMNNCLADLSRLIPPEYLKKGRGRIEKTEIIEMAIKHIGHLQNAIASTRFNENSNSGSVPSPSSFLIKETSTVSLDQPLNLKHYKMGYLECMSEAMHFLVEVQGYFAGDSLCVQMINHLRKHCDKLMNENTFNFGKKQTGGEGARSESSGSPINATFNGSSPLGMSHSVGSPSDDNQQHQEYPIDGYYSPKRYLDLCCNLKGHLDNSYSKYVESDGVESENRSDTEPQSNVTVKCLSGERIMEDSKTYCEPEGTCHRIYPVLTSFTESGNHGGVPVKEENGGSQLREMLTSPTSGNVSKREASPTTSTASTHEVGSSENKTRCSSGGNGDDPASGNGEINHVIMYKFKNNIKQRFSKEKKKNGEWDSIESQVPLKKTRLEECQKCEDSLMKERLALMDRGEPETEETINLNNEDAKRRFPLESDFQNGDLSNRLNFGHRANERGTTKRWEDSNAGPIYHPQKPWLLSPTSSFPHYGVSGPCKGPFLDREFPPLLNNSYNGLTTSSVNSGPGIPIFALHAKGSFYVPLTLDQATLAPFLTLLGLSKVSNSENTDEKRVLHPVTISVNFQSHLIR